jgi:hypothetical protein
MYVGLVTDVSSVSWIFECKFTFEATKLLRGYKRKENGTMIDIMQALYGVQRIHATPLYNMILFPIHFIVNVLASQQVR